MQKISYEITYSTEEKLEILSSTSFFFLIMFSIFSGIGNSERDEIWLNSTGDLALVNSTALLVMNLEIRSFLKIWRSDFFAKRSPTCPATAPGQFPEVQRTQVFPYFKSDFGLGIMRDAVFMHVNTGGVI